jgi:Virulence factor BrkB
VRRRSVLVTAADPGYDTPMTAESETQREAETAEGRREPVTAERQADGPGAPTDLSRRSWIAVLKRTVKDNFSSYNKTYGALASVVVFLIWLWISNTVILLGAEFNAELGRERQIRAGHVAADEEPFLPPRDEPKG